MSHDDGTRRHDTEDPAVLGTSMTAVTAAEAARAALHALDGGPAVVVVAMIEGPDPGRRVLFDVDGARRGTLGDAVLDEHALELARGLLDEYMTGTDTPDERAIFEELEVAGERIALYAEVHHAPPSLVVVGAGHIAVPLAELGTLLGYQVIVLDDREDFATPVRFPEEAVVRRMDFEDPFRDVGIGPHAHVLLVTRAHKYDFDCLRQLLMMERGPGYIGMIGSRRRVRAAFGALLEDGIPRERIATVSAPVGLDIGAETPAEIAVSVVAEMTLLRRGGTGERLALAERVLDRFLPEAADPS